jgi:hypothetical protein
MSYTEYTECQAFFLVVRIGSPTPLTRKEVLILPPLGPRRQTHSLAWECVLGPNADEGTDTLVYSLKAILPLRCHAIHFRKYIQ